MKGEDTSQEALSPIKRKNTKMLGFKSYEIENQGLRKTSVDESTQLTEVQSNNSKYVFDLSLPRAAPVSMCTSPKIMKMKTQVFNR